MSQENRGFKSVIISEEGLAKIRNSYQKNKYEGQNLLWTDDYRVQLPIRMGPGHQSLPPSTIPEEWNITLQKFGQLPALSVKRNNKWVTLTYQEYYQQSAKFAKSLIALNYPEFTTINLIGFNTPEWNIAYMGSIFARCIPVGIYTTNSKSACQYIAQHSEAKIVVSENLEYAEKYNDLLGNNSLDRVVLYGDLPKGQYKDKMIGWNEFLALGKKIENQKVQERKSRQKPGNCCTLIYTSGTTGMPKGVMLSHDNFIWTSKVGILAVPQASVPLRTVSYLPLSHAAGQFIDIIQPMLFGHHVHFADPSALQGTLVQTLQEVRPEGFFSVPRVWEKIYSKMMQMAKSNTGILSKIATWAKSIGQQGTVKEARGEETSFQFKLAKKIVYNKVKQALGLDQCKSFVFGSAPLDPAIRKYFFSLNFFLKNGYGMTECTAPQSTTNPHKVNYDKPEDYLEVGYAIDGTQMKIHKENDKQEQGEICMRGRNVCMGYFKNAEDTSKTIDKEGFLHSGDLGKIMKDGLLYITGRAKQLIITAGGQNIPPILIENEIKNALPCVANVMVVGDYRKYLTCLISLKEDPPQSGNLEKAAIDFLSSHKCNIKTVKQAFGNHQFNKIIQQGLKLANNKAISRAQHVQDFYLMKEDFSVESGTLTPTLKLRRKEAVKKYSAEIQQMYTKPKI